MAGRQSAVEQSSKKFRFDERSKSPLEDGCKAVPLDELHNVKANQFVTVVGQEIRVESSVRLCDIPVLVDITVSIYIPIVNNEIF